MTKSKICKKYKLFITYHPFRILQEFINSCFYIVLFLKNHLSSFLQNMKQ